MAAVISLINMKGGVGKTTLTLHLAYDLAYRYAKKVLVIDCDPQANATEGLLTPEKYKAHKDSKCTVSDLFSDINNTLSPVAAASNITLPNFESIVCHARSFTNTSYIHLLPADI